MSIANQPHSNPNPSKHLSGPHSYHAGWLFDLLYAEMSLSDVAELNDDDLMRITAVLDHWRSIFGLMQQQRLGLCQPPTDPVEPGQISTTVGDVHRILEGVPDDTPFAIIGEAGGYEPPVITPRRGITGSINFVEIGS